MKQQRQLLWTEELSKLKLFAEYKTQRDRYHTSVTAWLSTGDKNGPTRLNS